MPRPDRIFVEGGFYHVYPRLGRGERVFDEEVEAKAFVGLLREIAERDGVTIFAWAMLPEPPAEGPRTPSSGGISTSWTGRWPGFRNENGSLAEWCAWHLFCGVPGTFSSCFFL